MEQQEKTTVNLDRDAISNKLDMDVLTKMEDLMKAKFPVMIEKYLDNAADYIAKLEEAFIDGKVRALADYAHPLKSSSASLGVMAVSELAKTIENNADDIDKNGGDLSVIEPLIGDLKDAFIAVEDTLRQIAKDKAVSI